MHGSQRPRVPQSPARRGRALVSRSLRAAYWPPGGWSASRKQYGRMPPRDLALQNAGFQATHQRDTGRARMRPDTRSGAHGVEPGRERHADQYGDARSRPCVLLARSLDPRVSVAMTRRGPALVRGVAQPYRVSQGGVARPPSTRLWSFHQAPIRPRPGFAGPISTPCRHSSVRWWSALRWSAASAPNSRLKPRRPRSQRRPSWGRTRPAYQGRRLSRSARGSGNRTG